MSWHYTPATRAPRVHHTAGTVPARPLEVGDAVRWPLSGHTDTVSAVTDDRRLVLFTRRPAAPLFLAPLEGDHTGAIVGVTAN